MGVRCRATLSLIWEAGPFVDLVAGGQALMALLMQTTASGGRKLLEGAALKLCISTHRTFSVLSKENEISLDC